MDETYSTNQAIERCDEVREDRTTASDGTSFMCWTCSRPLIPAWEADFGLEICKCPPEKIALKRSENHECLCRTELLTEVRRCPLCDVIFTGMGRPFEGDLPEIYVDVIDKFMPCRKCNVARMMEGLKCFPSDL